MGDENNPEKCEPKIEDVLKEIKKEVVGQAAGFSPDKPGENEIQNLKKVLKEADAEAGVFRGSAKNVDQANDPKSAETRFNENFLKLEQLIKDIKKQS